MLNKPCIVHRDTTALKPQYKTLSDKTITGICVRVCVCALHSSCSSGDKGVSFVKACMVRGDRENLGPCAGGGNTVEQLGG